MNIHVGAFLSEDFSMSSPTAISKRHVIAVAMLGIVLILSLRPWQAISLGNSKDRDAGRGPATVDESSVGSPDLVEPTRTKSHIRPQRPQPTIAETIELIKATTISGLDLPVGHPVPEGIAHMNALIHQAGVEPSRLRLVLKNADSLKQVGIRYKFRAPEMPLKITLKYFCQASNLRLHVRENGIVELLTHAEWDLLPAAPDQTKFWMRPPPGDTDIFRNHSGAPEEPDPFADPTSR